MGRLAPALLPLVVGLSVLVACDFRPTSTDWLSQPSPSGPCYEVNLLDGLSETSAQELNDTYACLNREGALTPLGRVVASLETPTRSGDVAAVELARSVNALLGADLDVFGALGLVVDGLEAEGDPLRALVERSVELLYGRGMSRVQNGEVSLMAASSLDQGLVRPLLPALRMSARAILDDGAVDGEILGPALRSDTTREAAHTLAALASSEDPALSALMADLGPHLGDALARARDGSNDRWSEASGDALRDLADKLLIEYGNDGRMALEHLADPGRGILSDAQLRDRLLAVVDRLEREGRLEALPAQLVYLTQVDRDGGALTAGEDSALVTLLRLIHAADGPMRCSLDLWVTSLDVEIDNLSVSLLETLAQQDPGTVEGGVDLLGTVIGWGVSETVLYAVADSGVCDILDRPLVDDLQALDRFNDAQTSDLLISIVILLEGFESGSPSRMPELVDALSTVYAFGAAEPIEELLRDIGTSPLVYDVLELLPILRNPGNTLDRDPAMPAELGWFDLKALWGVLDLAFAQDESGKSAVERLAPAIRAAVQQDGTWLVVENLGALMADPTAAPPLSLLPPLLALDPELTTLDTLATAAETPAVTEPLLRVIETPEVVTALGEAELSAEGPMPFYARLVTGGTLDALLAWVDWSLSLLRG